MEAPNEMNLLPFGRRLLNRLVSNPGLSRVQPLVESIFTWVSMLTDG